MYKLKYILKEFVYGGHLFALSNVAIVSTFIILYGQIFNLIILIIPYLITQVIYSYNHFKEIDFDIESNPERSAHINSQKNTSKITFLIYILLLIFFVCFTNLLTIIITIVIVTGGILYTDYFKELISKKLTGLKSIYTCLFWGMLMFLVASFYDINFTGLILFLFPYVFLRGMINTIFSDIKDIESDKKRSLRTFPVILGKSKILLILQLLNIISIFPLLIGVLTNFIPNEFLLLLAFVIYDGAYLLKARNITGKGLRNLTYVIADGEYILWPIFIIIGKILI